MAKATTKKTSKKEAKNVESKKKVQDAEKKVAAEPVEVDKKKISIEKKLVALYSQQLIDSKIDKIRVVRGELPLEVQDLEDDITGLETRVKNFSEEIELIEKKIVEKQNSINESMALVKKYEEQKMNVRNNREFNSITKEIEYQNLEVQLNEKKMSEANSSLKEKKENVEKYIVEIDERKKDLDEKRNELDDIVSETEKEEKQFIVKSEKNNQFIEERLLISYSKIRKNARNGLAVVIVERDACGGCFNKIPPQKQLDIRMHKKIIVCEHCGRILIDEEMASGVTIN